MNKLNFLYLLLFALLAGLPGFSAQAFQRGEILKSELIGNQGTFQLNLIRDLIGVDHDVLPKAKYDVDFYRLTYKTIGVQGEDTQATGLVEIPRRPGSHRFPMVEYMHGTTFLSSNVPSESTTQIDALTCAIGFASHGYIAIAPDYLGLGQHPSFHPYLHAKTEGSAGADLLVAAKTFVKSKGLALNGQLFLMGYSQGGHATLALHRYLEEDEGVTVTASAPMDGPYDLSGVMMKARLSATSPTSTATTVYILYAMDVIYGLTTSPGQLFQHHFRRLVKTLFNGRTSDDVVYHSFPSRILDVVEPPVYRTIQDEAAQNDSNDPLAQRLLAALEENNVYEWTPRAPVLLIHARSDDEVPFENTQVAYRYFKDHGAQAAIRDLGYGFTHESAALPAMIQGYLYFTDLVDMD